MSANPYTLPAEQREQILTQEITKRTSMGKATYLAARPGAAYLRYGSRLTKAWPLVLAVRIGWMFAAMLVVLLVPLIGIVLLFFVPWYVMRTLPRVEVITVGDRGDISTRSLYWRGAYKMESYLAGNEQAEPTDADGISGQALIWALWVIVVLVVIVFIISVVSSL